MRIFLWLNQLVVTLFALKVALMRHICIVCHSSVCVFFCFLLFHLSFYGINLFIVCMFCNSFIWPSETVTIIAIYIYIYGFFSFSFRCLVLCILIITTCLTHSIKITDKLCIHIVLIDVYIFKFAEMRLFKTKMKKNSNTNYAQKTDCKIKLLKFVDAFHSIPLLNRV